MPSIGDVLFISIFLKTLVMGQDLLNDGDTGWHIATGNAILENMSIPDADVFSHTAYGASWTVYSWLSDVIFAAIHGATGLNGVVAFSAAVIALTYTALFGCMVRTGANPVAAAALSLVAAAASTGHWLARPHIFSLSFTLAFIVILELYRHGGRKHLGLLPVLMVLWVNLHPGFMLGLALVFIYTACELHDFLTSKVADGGQKARIKALGITAAITALAACVNPYGPAILYLPFNAAGISYVTANIKEWASPDFHVEKAFEFMLLLCLAVFVMSRKGPDLAGGAVSLLLTVMALGSVRYIPEAALAVTMVTARMTGDAADRLAEYVSANRVADYIARHIRDISANVAAMEKRPRTHSWALLFTVACVLATLYGGRADGAAGPRTMDYSYAPDRFPVAAAGFAHDNGLTGRMFNEYGWGGYIIYRGYPEQKVFIDGRIEPYGLPVMKDYRRVELAELGYDAILDRYGVDWVLFTADSPLCRLLAADGWKQVYKDDTAEVLVRDLPRYGGLIETYRPLAGITGPQRVTHEN